MELEKQTKDERRPQRQILWGVFLMAVGVLFLLDQTGVIEMPSIWRFWPIVLLVMSVSRLWAGQPGSGAMLALMGLAFFAAEFNWMGISYHNFWPLLLVAVGVGLVIVAVGRGEWRRGRREASHE
jgi:apolipoprotein N-acyltransferase